MLLTCAGLPVPRRSTTSSSGGRAVQHGRVQHELGAALEAVCEGARPFDQPSRWPRRRARRLCGCPRAARAPIRVHSAASLGCASVQLTASRGRACARAQGQRARIRAPTTRSTRASSAAGRAGTTPGSDAGVPPGSRRGPVARGRVPSVPLSAVLASDKCSARGVFSHRPAHPGR